MTLHPSSFILHPSLFILGVEQWRVKHIKVSWWSMKGSLWREKKIRLKGEVIKVIGHDSSHFTLHHLHITHHHWSLTLQHSSINPSPFINHPWRWKGEAWRVNGELFSHIDVNQESSKSGTFMDKIPDLQKSWWVIKSKMEELKTEL